MISEGSVLGGPITKSDLVSTKSIIVACSDISNENSSTGNTQMLLFSFRNICSFIFTEHVSQGPAVLILGPVIIPITDSRSK
jgi:hypothetical protein